VSRGFSGLRAWVVQRISAIYLALFTLIVAVAFVIAPPVSDTQWRAVVAQPLVQMAAGLYVLTLAAHAWVGLRDVIMDYLKPAGMRLAALSIVALILGASALWALRTLVLVNIP
jgi:succinate dehydrogenase / fumarate reductase membrane anchor subunit